MKSVKKIGAIICVILFCCIYTAGCIGTNSQNTSETGFMDSIANNGKNSGTQSDLIWQVLPQFTPITETYPPNTAAPTAAGSEVADLIVYAKNPENTVRLGESASIDVVFESIADSPGIVYAFPPKMLIAYREKLENGRYQVVDYIDERGNDVTISPGEKINQSVIWTPNESGEFCLAVMDVNIFDGERWYGYYSNVDPDRGVPVANITVKNAN